MVATAPTVVSRDRGARLCTRRSHTGLAALLFLAGGAECLAGVVYVNAASPSGGDGAAWATAFRTVEAGLAIAQPGDQLWVAKGTYTAPFTVPTSSFIVPAGVSLYGGFLGNEMLVSQAEPDVHVTILKGRSPDPPEAGPVLILRHSADAVVSGFTIRDGMAFHSASYKGGGGMLIEGGSVDVVDCIFVNNRTMHNPGQNWGHGGAICSFGGASLTISGCTFDSNVTHGRGRFDFPFGFTPAAGHGGAIYTDAGDLRVNDSRFLNNRAGSTLSSCSAGMFVPAGDAGSGGAIFASHATVELSRCTFTANAAGSSSASSDCQGFVDPIYPTWVVGGAAGAGGAINLESGQASISRCVFLANSSGTSDAGSASGGAVYANGPATIVNCRFLGNRAGNGLKSGDAGDGGGVYANVAVTLINCDLVGNAAGAADQAGRPPGIDGFGGAIFANARSQVLNGTLARNTARGQAAGAYNVDFVNSIIYFNSSALIGQSLDAQAIAGTAFYTVVQGWPTTSADAFGNFGDDPLFLSIAGPDATPGTLDDDPRLGSGSRAIDSGNNARVPLDTLDLDGDGDTAERVPVDLADARRMTDDPTAVDSGFGSPPLVDRGAYEIAVHTCPADLTLDGQVDDADFAEFALAYNLFDCASPSMPGGCPADLDYNGFVDDADFVVFAAAYNALLCP